MTTIQLPIDDSVTKQLSDVVVEESRKAVNQMLQAEIPYIHKEFLTANELCKMMGISHSTFQSWRKKGLRVAELGERTLYIDKKELRRFLKEFER